MSTSNRSLTETRPTLRGRFFHQYILLQQYGTGHEPSKRFGVFRCALTSPATKPIDAGNSSTSQVNLKPGTSFPGSLPAPLEHQHFPSSLLRTKQSRFITDVKILCKACFLYGL